EGFRHMSTLNVHFGIGTLTSIDSVHVLWPSGTVDVVINPAINETILFVEGSHPMSALSLHGSPVMIYPNPTFSELNIENVKDLPVARMTISSNLGTEVMRLTPQQSVADVSGLSSGLYILTIELSNGK